jgi:rare lipoprotein A (peptidoglycan hydrolase)
MKTKSKKNKASLSVCQNSPSRAPKRGLTRWQRIAGLFFIILFSSGVANAEIASWYDSKSACGPNTTNLPGCPTADGSSIFKLERSGDLFCAFNDAPLGTRLRITNPKNGKSVVVKVRDRGGFKKYGRAIDLGKKSFMAIADIREGLATVKIERF